MFSIQVSTCKYFHPLFSSFLFFPLFFNLFTLRNTVIQPRKLSFSKNLHTTKHHSNKHDQTNHQREHDTVRRRFFNNPQKQQSTNLNPSEQMHSTLRNMPSINMIGLMLRWYNKQLQPFNQLHPTQTAYTHVQKNSVKHRHRDVRKCSCYQN